MFGLGSNHAATGTASIVVNKPVDQVFRFIGIDFFENYPRWSPEVRECELLTDPPLRLNSVARQVRIDQGQRSESTFKVTVYRPDRQLVFEGVSNAYRCSYDLISRQTVTELIFTFELLRLELFMLPFEKLIRIAVQDGAQKTVKNLKILLEAD